MNIQPTDRRDFLRKLARGGLVGLLAVGTASLVARRNDRCGRQGLCRGCPAMTDCELPSAQAFRRLGTEEKP